MGEFDNPEKIYPVGLGRERNHARETLQAMEIKNKVAWFSPAFLNSLPINLRQGERANIGIFLNSSGGRSVEVDGFSDAGRGGVLMRASFADREGNKYRDVGIKGIGFYGRMGGTGGTHEVMPVQPREEGEDSFGICNRADAELDAGYSERFHSIGIRVARPIAIMQKGMNELFCWKMPVSS